MLKKLKEYLPNIDFMSGITVTEKWMLRVMIALTKDNEEAFVDIETFVAWSGLSERTIKDVRKSLKDNDFIFVKRNYKNNRHIYGINKQKLQDSIRTYGHDVTGEEAGAKSAPLSSGSAKSAPLDCDISAKSAPVTPGISAKSALHNGDSILTRNNVNNGDSVSLPKGLGRGKDGSVVFYKINNFENRLSQLTSALTYLKTEKLIKGDCYYRDMLDLLADLDYHANNRRNGLSEVGAVNAALRMIQNGQWSRPKGLREEIERQAEAREQAAKLEKDRELQDIRTSKVTHIVFGGDRSSLTTAQLKIQEMMSGLRKG